MRPVQTGDAGLGGNDIQGMDNTGMKRHDSKIPY